MQVRGLTHTPCFLSYLILKLQDFLRLLLLTFHLLRDCWQLYIIFESNLETLLSVIIGKEKMLAGFFRGT